MIYTLGIHWEMNSSACLFCDGQLVGAISEERISRVKNDERYPRLAIDHLLTTNSLDAQQIKTICIASTDWAPERILTRSYTKFGIAEHIKEQKEYWYPKFYEFKKCDFFEIFRENMIFGNIQENKNGRGG